MDQMMAAHIENSKFGIPSWRIEQKYDSKVLIGNWAEERLKFPDTKYKHNSTNRIDFKSYGEVHPDVTVRRNALLNNEGLPADMIFRHHDDAYNNMLITTYDENFNGRWRENNLPALRKWDSQTLGWLPERSDYPLRGPPTNFGLKQEIDARNEARRKACIEPEFSTTYTCSYKEKPVDAMRFTRHATPKYISTSLLPSNKINNNLLLRGKPALRLPEIMPQELTQISV
ncbi:cilia- and flagella-associated protein 107-like [Physella acuta]|uniref:cilia- and flagella-associated protein 107-like n=1 Tax=Physella acuta TaxID=109671 RepID=UPI0027DBFDAB|nr:cilia- and flagella-associated protein 107-like [Physella acuta]